MRIARSFLFKGAKMADEQSVATEPTETPSEQLEIPAVTKPATDGKAIYTQEDMDAVIGKKRSANKEAEQLRKKNEALEAKQKAIDDANKTEAQKIEEERNEYKSLLESTVRDNKLLVLEKDAVDHGVQKQYATYIAEQMSTVSEEEGFDSKVWLDKHKEDNKAFWKNTTTALGSGQGGPTTTPPDAKAAEIAQLEKQISETRDIGKRISYRRRINELTGRLEWTGSVGG
jgi:hypothetical protein